MAQPLIGRRYLFDQSEEQNYEFPVGESNTVAGQGVNLGQLTQQRQLGQDINAILGVNNYDGTQTIDERIQNIQKLDKIETLQLLNAIKAKKSELERQLTEANEAKQKSEFEKLIDQKVKEKQAELDKNKSTEQ